MSLSPPHLKDGMRWRGMRIGLLGGSFNPPHAGHTHIARLAQARFGLDFVWWLVTPQNPLKETKDTADYAQRFAQVEAITAPYPTHMATHLEREIGSRYTYESVSALKHAFPQTDFLWICGMDNARIFHRWDRWQELLALIPMTFIARPPARSLVQNCPLRQYAVPHYHRTQGRQTDLSQPGVYWLASSKMVDLSSTKIRNNIK